MRIFLEDDVSETITPYHVGIDKPATDSPIYIRSKWISGSKTVHGVIVPYIDIISSNHFLCPGHCIQIEFECMRSSFSLMTDKTNTTKYKIKMVDMVLYACVLEPLPGISNSLQKNKNNRTVQYPITRNVIRTRQIHSVVSRIEIDNIFGTGTLPRALYVLFLEEGQISGVVDKNLFVFKNYNVMESNVMVNGLSYPFEPIRTNVTANQIDVMAAYRFFLDNIGILDNDCDVGITAEKYRTNFYTMAFDLSPRGVHIS